MNNEKLGVKLYLNNNKLKIICIINAIIFKLIFIFFLLLLFIVLNQKPTVCLCTVGKKENNYIREFIEHYQNYEVDKIFLYDNNDLKGEKFEDVIKDYIEKGYVEIINFRGKEGVLLEMMNDCYFKTYKYYEWIIFFEVDEYIYLKNYKSVKDYLKNTKFNKCERIQLNWIFHTDNNLLYYDNRPLKIRFPEREKRARGVKKGSRIGIKSILKGKIPNIKIECVHTLNHKLKSCDGFGNPKEVEGIITRDADFYYYYIDHYYCKSTEEFINKINRGDVLHKKKNIMQRINTYFSYNKITKEKIDLIEKGTGLDLKQIKQINQTNQNK